MDILAHRSRPENRHPRPTTPGSPAALRPTCPRAPTIADLSKSLTATLPASVTPLLSQPSRCVPFRQKLANRLDPAASFSIEPPHGDSPDEPDDVPALLPPNPEIWTVFPDSAYGEPACAPDPEGAPPFKARAILGRRGARNTEARPRGDRPHSQRGVGRIAVFGNELSIWEGCEFQQFSVWRSG